MASPAVLSLILKRHTVCKAWMPPLSSGGGMFTMDSSFGNRPRRAAGSFEWLLDTVSQFRDCLFGPGEAFRKAPAQNFR